MTLSVNDQVTLVEAGVIIVGVVITWAIYRRPGGSVDLPDTVARGTRTDPRREPSAGRSSGE